MNSPGCLYASDIRKANWLQDSRVTASSSAGGSTNGLSAMCARNCCSTHSLAIFVMFNAQSEGMIGSSVTRLPKNAI